MNLKIRMENIHGEYEVVYSKSTMHRALFCAMLCKGITTISNITLCDDVIATLNVLRACNCKITFAETTILIDSTEVKKPSNSIECKESASTLRMAMIICAFLFKEVSFIVDASLAKRPIDGYNDMIRIEKNNLQINCCLNIIPSTIDMDVTTSSQYVSGLLLIAPLAKIKQINLKNKVVSGGYIELTCEVMKCFGVNTDKKVNKIKINNTYNTDNFYENEIDESSMAFFKVLKALGADVEQQSENANTVQPDKEIANIINNNFDVIDIDNCPDLLPIVALLCCFKKNNTTIINTERTIIKESNRLLNTQVELNKLGANIHIIKNNEMLIKPVERFNKNVLVDSCGDHRIEMMLVIAAYRVDELKIENAGHNQKSFPEFYENLLQLGAIIEEYHD